MSSGSVTVHPITEKIGEDIQEFSKIEREEVPESGIQTYSVQPSKNFIVGFAPFNEIKISASFTINSPNVLSASAEVYTRRSWKRDLLFQKVEGEDSYCLTTDPLHVSVKIPPNSNRSQAYLIFREDEYGDDSLKHTAKLRILHKKISYESHDISIKGSTSVSYHGDEFSKELDKEKTKNKNQNGLSPKFHRNYQNASWYVSMHTEEGERIFKIAVRGEAPFFATPEVVEFEKATEVSIQCSQNISVSEFQKCWKKLQGFYIAQHDLVNQIDPKVGEIYNNKVLTYAGKSSPRLGELPNPSDRVGHLIKAQGIQLYLSKE